ncbi:MAG: shikimate dehydrogenase [Bacteroidales bacterium]|nr:shikimate dehydrogenase [Candidatus Liminaster caballi]
MPETVKYGLLGHPLGHSFSRQFHNQRFEQLGIDAVYENFDLEDIGMLPELLSNEPALRGLNVTIPYKQQVMQYLDELDPLAERIGAVNVIRVSKAMPGIVGKAVPSLHLKGYNSDIVGFRESIRPMLQEAGIIDVSGRAIGHHKSLILGTGGASRAIFVALQDFGLEPIYVSRTAAPGRLTYADLTVEVMAECPVIVNCTPLGMFPKVDACPDIPYHMLNPRHVCFDAVYNPAETLFMKKAAAHGAAVKCGYDMLVGQAIESYELWNK